MGESWDKIVGFFWDIIQRVVSNWDGNGIIIINKLPAYYNPITIDTSAPVNPRLI
jgi:hypothetical protein